MLITIWFWELKTEHFAGIDTLEGRLRWICKEEDVRISDEGISALISVSDGDLRRAITTLQSAARLQAGEELTNTLIFDITGELSSNIKAAINYKRVEIRFSIWAWLCSTVVAIASVICVIVRNTIKLQNISP